MDTQLFAIAGFYTGICCLILLWLTFSIVGLRRKYQISLSDGGNKHLARTMRGQANALENMIIVLIAMIIFAALGAPAYLMHAIGLVLVISRALHAHHFIQEDAAGWTRRYSTIAGVALILTCGLGLIVLGIHVLMV